MTRLIGTFAVLLVLAGLATVATAGGARDGRVPAGPRDGEVVNLSDVPEPRQASAQARPHEDLSDQEMAAIERDIRKRSARAGASSDDGIAEGAPSDAQVRRDLKEVYGGAGGAGPIRRGGGDLVWPVRGAFTSPFGMRWGRLHAGIDVAAASGTPIRAAASGRVILMAPTGGYGNYTCVSHGASISTCYAHQSRFGTTMGAPVRQGEVIGYVGNTGHSFGAHLHFEVRVDGRPVDPMRYL